MEQETLDQNIDFLSDGERKTKAGAGWWLASGIAFFAYFSLNVAVAILNKSGVLELVGTVLGSCFWPIVVTFLFVAWDIHCSQKRKVIAFFVASTILLLISMAVNVAERGYISVGDLTPAQYKNQAVKCMQAKDLYCAEKNWSDYVKLRPNEALGIANLGIVQNQRENHREAIKQFEKVINFGEGTYDMFAYYADSLAKLGMTDEAIEWSYKSLSVVPKLVDVRGNLAKLLIQKKRNYEALALLENFDAQQEAGGHPPYFEAQRIAIETSMKQDAGMQPLVEMKGFRVSKLAGHFFVPLTLGEARPTSFMVDTGATKTALSADFLNKSKANYRVVSSNVPLITADGRQVRASLVTIESIMVGPFEVKNVSAFVCKTCALLLGQSTLSSFDMQSTKSHGIEFLTLLPRHF